MSLLCTGFYSTGRASPCTSQWNQFHHRWTTSSSLHPFTLQANINNLGESLVMNRVKRMYEGEGRKIKDTMGKIQHPTSLRLLSWSPHHRRLLVKTLTHCKLIMGLSGIPNKDQISTICPIPLDQSRYKMQARQAKYLGRRSAHPLATAHTSTGWPAARSEHSGSLFPPLGGAEVPPTSRTLQESKASKVLVLVRKHSAASLCLNLQFGLKANKGLAGMYQREGINGHITLHRVLCITNDCTVAFMSLAEYQWEIWTILLSKEAHHSFVCNNAKQQLWQSCIRQGSTFLSHLHV